jgi:hypothetical protein
VENWFSTFFQTFLTVTTLACLPAASSAEVVRPTVLVMLQNDAAVPAHVAGQAQAEVVRLYDLIGVEVVWVTKVPEPGRRLRVVSVVTWEPSEDECPPSVLGLTYGNHASRGTRAYVFWPRVERASLEFTAALQNVLAVAMAHELGHMLLPDGSHAKRGLMRAPWNGDDFRSASAGLLHFSHESAALVRRGLAEGHTLEIR